MKICTTRFGEIDIEESEFIKMQGAILGFENLKYFVLLSGGGNTPFWWLQSVQEPAVAFVVINPYVVKSDYSVDLSEDDFEFLDIKNSKDIALLVIVTIRSDPFKVTANLRAPILFNAENRTGSQIVLDNPDYPIQYDLLDNKANLNKGLSESMGGLGRLSPTMEAV
jgi:flagellar assembly factor FliW